MTQSESHYEAPVLQFVGKVEEVTLGHSNGSHLDAAFNSGTPGAQLTFS